MPITVTLPHSIQMPVNTASVRQPGTMGAAKRWAGLCAAFLVLSLIAFVSGCGTGGYAGGGITSLSSSSITIDAGQSVGITASVSGSVTPSWALSGTSCSGSACGALSVSSGDDVTYTAPSGLTTQLQVTLTAGIANTANSKTVSITVNPDPTISGSLPSGTIGTAYTATLTASGGTGTLTLSIGSGSLPAGLTFDASTGVISGTPTTAATSTFSVQVADQSNVPYTASVSKSITINSSGGTTGTLSLTGGVQPAGTVGVAYTTSFKATGGVTPYAWSIASGTLPAGLSISASTGSVTGVPTTAGSSSFVVQVTDASGATATASASITINSSGGGTLTLTTTTLPSGTVGVPYTGTIGVSGGTSPYSCTIASGTLPAGLKLSGCTVSGTPTTAGSSTVTVTATDSSSPANTVTGPETIVINPAALTLTTTTLPSGTVGVPYSGTIGASGGTSPYSCSITSGTLPAGLTLSGCTVSGTPTTAGSSTVTVVVTDSSSPAKTATGPETIVINPAALTLTTTTLPSGTVGVPYSGTIGASGGTSPYSCSITSGTLPAGLTLSGCTVSGTPTTAGSSTVTVVVADSSSPAKTATGPETIVINPAALTLTTTTLPNGTVGVPYTGTIGASGGKSPYGCTIASGTLPAGLILNGCTVSGTPTTAGSSKVTVTVTDSSSPTNTVTGPETIVISPAALTLTTTTLPNGTVGVPYSGTIGASGGTSPYSCSITSGTLPAGLTLSGCTVSGTPTTAGSSTVTVVVTDSSSPAKTATGPETIVINPAATLTLTTATLPDGTVNIPYSATIGASGGTPPYVCKINSGALPAGLTLAANSCVVSGTPTTAETSTVNVTVTDASSPQKSGTGNVSITIIASGALTLTATLPNAIVNQSYSYTFLATGGTQPYKSYEVTAGSLPAGLTLATDGVLSGTPTATGANSFTVTVTDTANNTASVSVVLLVVYQSSPNDSELVGPYAYLFQGYDDVVAGVLAYQTATVGSFTADGKGGITAGELDSNHQSSTTTGTTVPKQTFLGTYIVNANNQGFITITTLNSDGTTNQTSTYAISLKAPVSPATVATEGSLIEYDNNQLVGTKGSGTLLAQTTSTFSAGLKGSYAFGFSGDTPCLISCTLGIASGPVATVGQFTTDGAGNISSGTADTNIASANFASAPLSGSYEVADQNGRLTMVLSNTSISDGVYPSDYAVYIVNANEAFIVSTDTHSAYTLLAGTTQLQTTPNAFTNTSMDVPFIGYENAQVDPGLLGQVLQNVLNFSSASIFRASGDGSGNCTTTDIDSAGLTNLVNNVTGILNGTQLLEALLGNSTATGTAGCAVTSNGRVVLDYPPAPGLISFLLQLLGLPTGAPAPRIAYLVSPGTGYFLESSYAGLGHLEEQTGSPFSLATLDGTFVESTIPASSLASITTSGYFTAYGNGQALYAVNANIGVGTLNVLQLGTVTNTTYTLTNNNATAAPTVSAATAGRYLLGDGSTVIYAISPDRFVLLNTSPLTTSPGVSLLY